MSTSRSLSRVFALLGLLAAAAGTVIAAAASSPNRAKTRERERDVDMVQPLFVGFTRATIVVQRWAARAASYPPLPGRRDMRHGRRAWFSRGRRPARRSGARNRRAAPRRCAGPA